MIPAALLALALGAPVPAYLSAPPTPPVAVRQVAPGFRWQYGGHCYECVAVDETMLRYVCVDCPSLVHGGLDGAEDGNWQSVGRTIREANGNNP